MNTITRCLSLAVFLVPALCVQANSSNDEAEFKEAYAAYQQHIEQDKLQLALPHAKRAMELGEELFEPGHPNRAALTYNYGLNLIELRQFKAARPVMKKAVKMYEALHGKDSAELIPVLLDYGHARADMTDSDPQTFIYRRALRLIETHHGRNSVAYAKTSMDAGIHVLHDSKSTAARRFLVDAHETFVEVLGPEHEITGLAAFYVGKYYLVANRYTKSRDYFLLALDIFEDPEQPSNSFEMSAHAFLVQVYEKMKQSEEATKHCLAVGRMSPTREDQDFEPLYRIEPTYPTVAMRRGQEGHVDVSFTVDKSGFVKNVAVAESTENYFEEAALAAVADWRYAPRFEEGAPVSTEDVRVRLTFQFTK